MKPRGRDEDGTAEQVELEHAGNTHAVEWSQPICIAISA